MAHDKTPEMSRLEGKKAIRSYARKLSEPEVIKDLNITPMMDMMTIILVFLLKTFSGSTSAITFDQNLQVPKSTTQLKPKEAVTVRLSGGFSGGGGCSLEALPPWEMVGTETLMFPSAT